MPRGADHAEVAPGAPRATVAGPGDAPAPASAADPVGASVEVGLHWLGHSTVLIELPGAVLMTDPFLRARLGPLRRHGPMPDPAALPPIDAVLLSHAHPDHFDRRSLRAIEGDPLIVVPRGMLAAVTRARPRSRVEEVHLGEVLPFGPWAVHAVRARHWRWPFTPNARTVGYLVEGPAGIYFAGDTSEFGGMRDLAGRVDVALLPIGRWGPQPTPGHLTPASAARVVATIGARHVIPIHWGTLYPRGLERITAGPLRQPAEQFAREVERRAPAADVHVLLPGDRTVLRLPDRTAESGGHAGS